MKKFWKTVAIPAVGLAILAACTTAEKEKPKAPVIGKEATAESEPTESAPMGTERVSNPSLETVKDGMAVGYKDEPIPGKTLATAKCTLTNDAHTGSNALVMVRLNDGGVYGIYPPFEKIVPADSVRYFKASVWMKSIAAQGAISANVQCADSRWAKGFHQYYGEVNSEWAEYSLLIRLEPGNDISFFRICVGYGLTVNGDRMFLDDFSLRELSADEFARQVTRQRAAGKIEWNKVATPAKNSPGVNLLRNSSFENSLEHWGFSYTMQCRARNEQMSLDGQEKVHGSHSMRYQAWPRWYEAGGRIQSPPLPVQKGNTYTLSAYMKSNEPGIEAVLEVRHASSSPPAVTQSCKLTDSWQRFSLTFEVGTCPKGSAIAVIAMPGTWLKKEDLSHRTVWIDAVQLEEGGMSEYAPLPTAEVMGGTSKDDSLFVEGEPVTLRTQLNSPDALNNPGGTGWNLVYEFENVFGDIVDTRTFAIAPPPKGTGTDVEHSFTWDTPLLGSYCAHITLKSGNTVMAKGITVLGILPELPTETRQHAGLFGVNVPSSPFLCGIAMKMGAGSIRLHQDYYLRWEMLQQDKGDACWYEPEKDKALKAMRDAGIHVLGTMELSSMWASTAPDSIQGWERIKYPPDLDAWRVFVRTQTAHFKDIVDAWEIWNEPYLQQWWNGTPEQYVAMLEASCQEIKKVDPSLPVVGICGQSSNQGWNAECVKAGALNSMDAFSFHDYLSRQSGGPEENWISNVAAIREMLVEAGKDVPIWNSEAGIGDGHDSYYTRFYTGRNAPRMSPALLVQAYATSLAAGMERLYWFNLTEDNGPSETGGLAMIEYNGAPKPVIPAFAVCVKQLAGKKLARKVDLGKDTVCFIYVGAGHPVAVLWRSMGASALQLEFPDDAVRAFDIMGNALPTADGKVSTQLGAFPIYVQGNGSVEELALALLK